MRIKSNARGPGKKIYYWGFVAMLALALIANPAVAQVDYGDGDTNQDQGTPPAEDSSVEIDDTELLDEESPGVPATGPTSSTAASILLATLGLGFVILGISYYKKSQA